MSINFELKLRLGEPTMKKIKAKHYIDTIIFSIDLIIKGLKNELKQKIDNLNIGITGEQFVVLDTIYCYPDIYQQKLSDILSKDKSNTTRILGVLEEKGYIQKTISRHNNRLVNLLNITDKGEQIIENNMPNMKKFLTNVFENITDEEIDLLHKLSAKFQKDLSKVIKA